MQFPICIEWGDSTTAVGIQIPDIPGAATAGDTFEQALQNALEVAGFLLRELALDGRPLPKPSTLATHRNNPAFRGMSWRMIQIDYPD